MRAPLCAWVLLWTLACGGSTPQAPVGGVPRGPDPCADAHAAIFVEPSSPRLHAGVPAQLTLRTQSPCPMDLPVDWEAELDTHRARGSLLVGDRVYFDVPAMKEGTYILRIELKGLDERSVMVEVGPECGDFDGDGHSNCEGDCDDLRAAVFPGAEDVVGDGLDNDCDGVNGHDMDRDGHEAVEVGGRDCADDDPKRHPGAPEGADLDGDGYPGVNGIDDNCDGRVDEDLPTTDCDDTRADVHPGADEAPDPNGRDDNCDGRVDEGTIVFDDDGDGLAEVDGDCDDADALRRPGLDELPDCRDQDCDGAVDEGLTRPQVDDAWDTRRNNDALPDATDLNTTGQRDFRKTLKMVNRNDDDAEHFRFFSHDGPLDSWGIVAKVVRMPHDAVYEVTVMDAHGGIRALDFVRQDGDRLHVTGKFARNDSGDYFLRVRPHQVPAWCPIEVELIGK